jgi:hypothetical protein
VVVRRFVEAEQSGVLADPEDSADGTDRPGVLVVMANNARDQEVVYHLCDWDRQQQGQTLPTDDLPLVAAEDEMTALDNLQARICWECGFVLLNQGLGVVVQTELPRLGDACRLSNDSNRPNALSSWSLWRKLRRWLWRPNDQCCCGPLCRGQ